MNTLDVLAHDSAYDLEEYYGQFWGAAQTDDR